MTSKTTKRRLKVGIRKQEEADDDVETNPANPTDVSAATLEFD